MNIVKWVPDDEITTIWDRWVQKHEEGSAAGRGPREEAPKPDEPIQASKSEGLTQSRLV